MTFANMKHLNLVLVHLIGGISVGNNFQILTAGGINQYPLYYNFKISSDSDSPFYSGDYEILHPGEHLIFKYYDSLSSVPEDIDKDIIPNTGGPVWIGKKDDGVFMFAHTSTIFYPEEDEHGNIISENVYREIYVNDNIGGDYEYIYIKFRNENSYDIVEFTEGPLGYIKDINVTPIPVYE